MDDPTRPRRAPAPRHRHARVFAGRGAGLAWVSLAKARVRVRQSPGDAPDRISARALPHAHHLPDPVLPPRREPLDYRPDVPGRRDGRRVAVRISPTQY